MTRKGTGKSREHQLTHQLTCRIPRAPCHCRAGSVVDVAATGFDVTDECSGLVHPSVSVLVLSSTCCCPWRGTRSYRHVCLPPLERAGLACSYCMRSQPRGGTPQQAHACSRFLHYGTSLCTVMYCPDTRSVFTAACVTRVRCCLRCLRPWSLPWLLLLVQGLDWHLRVPKL